MCTITEPFRDIAGLYIDANACAVFVLPNEWKREGDDIWLVFHGANSLDSNQELDWIAHGKCNKDGLCTMHKSDKIFSGKLTKTGIQWGDVETWQKVNILNTQLRALRRPPIFMSVVMCKLIWNLLFYLATGIYHYVTSVRSYIRRLAFKESSN